MKTFILALFLASPLAQAQTYQLNVGQNAQLSAGDVAFVYGNGTSSAISCGGMQQPSYRDFPLHQVINLSGDFQNRQEDNARALCEQAIDYTIKNAGDKIVKDATNDCLRSGYQSCRQLGQTEYELVLKQFNGGLWGCRVSAVVRGQ